MAKIYSIQRWLRFTKKNYILIWVTSFCFFNILITCVLNKKNLIKSFFNICVGKRLCQALKMANADDCALISTHPFMDSATDSSPFGIQGYGETDSPVKSWVQNISGKGKTFYQSHWNFSWYTLFFSQKEKVQTEMQESLKEVQVKVIIITYFSYQPSSMYYKYICKE